MNQRPANMKSSMASGDRKTISAHDLLTFLDNAVTDLESKGEVEAATRFEIFRDYVKEDVIDGTKKFGYDGGVSLGL